MVLPAASFMTLRIGCSHLVPRAALLLVVRGGGA